MAAIFLVDRLGTGNAIPPKSSASSCARIALSRVYFAESRGRYGIPTREPSVQFKEGSQDGGSYGDRRHRRALSHTRGASVVNGESFVQGHLQPRLSG